MKSHTPQFLAIVRDAMSRVAEVSPQDALAARENDPDAALIDVREESEYAAGHTEGAEWIGKGVIERDIEKLHPNTEQPLYLYCGGGFRSALAADNLQKMGYKKVFSVAGGFGALKELAPVVR
ncbi:MAG: rhodanese-like domain-containing protein [Candidatus Sumerlaeia bacterium]|nr:rhodanese-like domain-containing protein [Candidatus Sumerlaeia bacterium]